MRSFTGGARCTLSLILFLFCLGLFPGGGMPSLTHSVSGQAQYDTGIGLYEPGTAIFFLRDLPAAGPADLDLCYGPRNNLNWIPLIGDWDGDGCETVGLYDPVKGIFYLRNSNTAGPADITFRYGPRGNKGWLPIAGDWNGAGSTTIGLYDPAEGIFYLRNSNTAGPADITFRYGPRGNKGWLPMAGDWNGAGRTTAGLYDPAAGIFYLRNSNTAGVADNSFRYGPAGNCGWLPLSGAWPPLARGTAILGPAQASAAQAQAWARSRGAHERFINIAPVYWQYGEIMGIRPEVLYAQSAKETAFGRYGGAVLPEQNNWAGIKIANPTGDRAEDHESFPTPEEGVRAHFNHICAYTGLEPLGTPHARYYVVASLPWAGTVRFVEELGGKWAPAPDYGTSIVEHYLKGLLGY